MRVHGWIPCLTGLVTTVLIVLVVISGINSHVLTNFFFLKAETSTLNIASKLSNSTFLRDLTSLTHTDFVGRNTTGHSLGLADTYTISLLTLCGKNISQTACSSPQFGFNFNPESDLELSNTALRDSLPKSLSTYSSTSKFLTIGYGLAILFSFFPPLINLFSYSAGAALGSAILSTLGSLFLLASSIEALVVFTNFSKAFNNTLSPYGAKSRLGSVLFAISWVATAFSLITTMLLFRSHHGASRNSGRRRGIPDQKAPEGANSGPRALRMLKRVQTWKMNDYRQIGKQGVSVQKVGGIKADPNDDDFDPLVREFGMEGIDEDPELEPAHGEGPHRGIAMQVFNKNEATKNTESVYEPYRAT
ncbi:SUR7/PalI family-domain-containing protein [Xylogone sp. PMI_703]|nr:SUR7/PalI family-domain-containing protein [Xylogone sp. PMI_703]